MRVTIIQPHIGATSETFINAHAVRLPADVTVIHHRFGIPWHGELPLLNASLPMRALRKIYYKISPLSRKAMLSRAYVNALRASRPDVVLAQYGTTGVRIMDACQSLQIPFVVHFHGHDASQFQLLERLAKDYQEMFNRAAGIICVSRTMEKQLIKIGAPRDKIHYSTYGIDCKLFQGANPATAASVFLAVGRFVEKKSPHYTLTAFARLYNCHPHVRLRMIGDGPLLWKCRQLCVELGIQDAVTFLGAQPHEVVQREMHRAMAFVQHSRIAPDGDSEGTPVAILEAGAAGLPVVATRHAGIPDVVVEGDTGLLVDEGDIAGMADAMNRFVVDQDLAARMGSSARNHISQHYSMERNIETLERILGGACSFHENLKGLQHSTGTRSRINTVAKTYT